MKKNDSVLLKKRKKSDFTTTSGLLKFFIVFFLCSLFVCAVMAAVSGGDSWKMMLFHSGKYTDMFMDFFNSIRDGGSPNVYSERNNIYPPLCILIFRLFSKMIDPSLVSSHFKNRTLLQLDELCMMIYFLFAIICILSLYRLIESYINIKNSGKFKLHATIISFMMIISYPVMFCLERGNILILSVIFAMFFIFFKDSENPIVREMSYIALACSAGIKLYPAVFGLILIIEKKYKDAIRLIIYGIIIVVFPIIFFIDEFKTTTASISPFLQISSASIANDGSASVLIKILENLLSFATKKKSSLNFSSVSIQNLIYIMKLNNGNTIAKIVCAITEAIAFFCSFNTKSDWKRVFLLAYLMLNIPSASNSYALSFLLIPFIMFMFGNEERKKSDRFFVGAFALLLTPLPTLWYFHQDKVSEFTRSLGIGYNTQLNQYLGTFVFQIIFFVIVAQTIITLLGKIKNRSSAKSISVNSDSENNLSASSGSEKEDFLNE